MAPGARGLCLGPSWSGCPSHGNEKWEMTGFSVLRCLGWGVHVPRAAAQTLVMGGGVRAGWPSTKGRPSLGGGGETLDLCLAKVQRRILSSDGASLGSVWVWLRPPLGSAALAGLPSARPQHVDTHITVFLGSTAQPGVQHSVGPTLPSPTLPAASTPQQPGASVPWAPALAQGPSASHTASARVAPTNAPSPRLPGSPGARGEPLFSSVS